MKAREVFGPVSVSSRHWYQSCSTEAESGPPHVTPLPGLLEHFTYRGSAAAVPLPHGANGKTVYQEGRITEFETKQIVLKF